MVMESGILAMSCKRNKNIYNVSEFNDESKQKRSP
jgi:hypothetical protein